MGAVNMYHIKKDKRSQRSARLIGEALLQCLQDTDFSDITITQIQQVSFVGRATFYRLFDSLTDVLTWLNDEVIKTILAKAKEKKLTTARDMHLLFLETWMQEDRLLETVLNHEGICSFSADLLLEDSQLISDLFPQLTETELQFIIPISMNTLLTALKTWMEHGKKETPEELLSIIAKSYKFILNHLNDTSVQNCSVLEKEVQKIVNEVH